jgi:hypothetical protein
MPRLPAITSCSIIALFALAGCGESDSISGPTATHTPTQERTARPAAHNGARPPAVGARSVTMTVKRKGKLAGSLIVKPAAAKPQSSVTIAVKNVGELTMYYGLGNRVHRRVDGRWKDATKDVYGTRSPAVRNIRLRARPGERAGPRYGDLVDRVRLPGGLAPGTYRVVKRVSGSDDLGPPGVRLEATFRVR